MRKTVLVLLLLSLVVFPITAASDNMIGKKIEVEVPVKVNGEYLSTNAIGLEGTTYIPVRVAFETIGANVEWDKEAGEVVIELPLEDINNEDTQSNEDGDNVGIIEETDVENIHEESVLEEEVDTRKVNKQDLLDRITELNERITATENANFFTQKAIDEYLAMLENDDLSQTRKDTIQERIAKSQEIIEKNNQIIADLKAEIENLEAELQK